MTRAMGLAFEPSEGHARIAEAYSLDAVDAAAAFGVSLDFSASSVEQVESILAKMHDEMAAAHPGEDLVWSFSKVYGSYVGEVIRRAHGGTWGLASLGDGEAVALELPATTSNRQITGPWYRVSNRFRNGDEDNVWHYYQVIVRDCGFGTGPRAPDGRAS